MLCYVYETKIDSLEKIKWFHSNRSYPGSTDLQGSFFSTWVRKIGPSKDFCMKQFAFISFATLATMAAGRRRPQGHASRIRYVMYWRYLPCRQIYGKHGKASRLKENFHCYKTGL